MRKHAADFINDRYFCLLSNFVPLALEISSRHDWRRKGRTLCHLADSESTHLQITALVSLTVIYSNLHLSGHMQHRPVSGPKAAAPMHLHLYGSCVNATYTRTPRRIQRKTSCETSTRGITRKNHFALCPPLSGSHSTQETSGDPVPMRTFPARGS